jgi:hypothetical protein
MLDWRAVNWNLRQTAVSNGSNSDFFGPLPLAQVSQRILFQS